MKIPVLCHEALDAVALQGLSPLPAAAREHLAGCVDCRAFVADLNSIVSLAREIPAEVEPPERIWISLRAQLAAEGVIRETVPAAVPVQVLRPRASWWQGLSVLLQGRALATAAAGLLIFAAAVVQLRNSSAPATPTATMPVASTTNATTETPTPSVARKSPPHQDALADSGEVLTKQEHELRSVQTAGTLSSSPVDDSLQKNLQDLDAFIAECEHHLQSDPQDQLAREYLAAAYQQKAQLLAEMLDRGRSVN
jgi:hypothetical protein